MMGVIKLDTMSNPMVHAFFIGRALAAAVGEQVEQTVTETLSTLGKFDAEQRENLRRFTEDVLTRAQYEEAEALQNRPSPPPNGTGEIYPQDLQATIDNLRAEIAQVRATLQQYRASLN
jgi:polyhydroxyalkanoate synthesis regulator phasin